MKLLIVITLLFIILMSALTIIFFRVKFTKKADISDKDSTFYIVLILLTGLIIKCVGSLYYYEAGDMGAFISWMNSLVKDGFGDFYSTHGLAYPPLHIFVVYIIGQICSIFNIADFSQINILLIKSPAIICDILTALLLYKIAKKYCSNKFSILICVAYILNPAAFFISGVWGQMDSIYTFFILLTCYLLSEKKLKLSFFAFAASILFKYQGIIFTPVIICAVLDQVILDKCTIKKFFINLGAGLGAIGTIVLCHVPFMSGSSGVAGSGDYTEALTSFKYASVNAYNIWAMCGLNWHTQEDKFMSLTYNQWGTISIVLLVILTIVFSLLMKKDYSKYYILSAFVIGTMFLFSVRMHERYLFPVIPLVLAALLVKPCAEQLLAYIGFTLFNLYNCAHVLFWYNPFAYDPKAPALIYISAGTLAIWVIMTFGLIRKNIVLRCTD